MEKAKKLPSGKWNARVYDRITGKRYSFTADTKKEAEQKAAAFKYESKHNTDMTVRDAAEAYVRAKSAILSPNTVKDYNCTIAHHIDGIAGRRISTITDTTLQVWVNDLASELSPKSVKNIYGFITSAIRLQNRSVRYNVTLPMKIRHELQMPSESDIRRIMNEIPGTDIECPVLLAIYCCMRRGEIAALLHHPECVGTNTVTVKYSMAKKGNEWIIKAPKTITSYRTIPCPEWLCMKARMVSDINPGIITDHWIKLMKKLQMPYRFHDLRHFAASSMMTVMPVVDVEKFGGWRHGSSVLQDIYTYNIDESLQRSAAAWNEKLDKLETNWKREIKKAL